MTMVVITLLTWSVNIRPIILSRRKGMMMSFEFPTEVSTIPSSSIGLGYE